MPTGSTRRSFLGTASASMAASQAGQVIPGFDQTRTDVDRASVWRPFSDRKIRMGLVGYGVCRFAAEFEFQNHPNVEVVAVSDLIPDRRAALARWLTRADNPLVWRSIVNRVWQWHFGRGIVETPNDFGRMGALPTHPELLDWLAAEFRDGSGSFKQLHRLIVNSAAYRQSSAHNEAHARIDSDNRFLWRANRRRLEAEEIRERILLKLAKKRARDEAEEPEAGDGC